MPTSYPFSVEFASSLGMFARPDSGSESCSYVVPPAPTAIGMIRSICWLKGVDIEPVAVGIAFRPRWTNYAFNSYSPIRKANTISDGNPCQIRATVLVEPRYVILGLAHQSNAKVPEHLSHVNHAHSFQSQLIRRLRRGQFYHPPVMGWKDFPITECGVQTSPVADYNTVIPTLMEVDYNMIAEGEGVGKTRLNVPVENGVMKYTEIPTTMKNGRLTFASPTLDDMLKQFCEAVTSD